MHIVCANFDLHHDLHHEIVFHGKSLLDGKSNVKGAGVFGRPGQNMEDLGVFGTSRSSNELKSVPQPPCQLRLMKRYFWSHKISHLWLKIGLFKAIFDLFLQVFCSTDHIYAYFKLEMDQELPYTYGKVG